MKFRKKPVEIEAMQWTGNNIEEISVFCGENSAILDGRQLYIFTLEGTLRADAGDWIIRGVKGEVYPCKPDIFEQIYERV